MRSQMSPVSPSLGGVLVRALLVAALATPFGGPAAAGPSDAAIVVSSDPAGAAVYVDGQARGLTPVELALPAGDHRVLVQRDGFLENARLVSVRPGESRPVHVRLTRAQVEDAPAPAQREEEAPRKGGGKKWLWLGLGAAAVGTGVFLLLPKNDPPVAVATVDMGGSAALMSATSVSFSGTGSSDPDGDPLTYSWNFGDGSTGSGATAAHVYTSAGTFTVTLTVSDGKKSSSATAAVTVKSLSGSWRGSVGGTTFTQTMTQSGTSLTGTFRRDFDGRTDSASGSVRAPRAVSLRFSFFCDTYELTGSSDLNTLTGNSSCSGLSGYNPAVTMTRQ